MIQTNLTEQSDQQTADKRIENRTHTPVLRREASFSRWCEDDGVVQIDHNSENTDTSVDDSDFELPLLTRNMNLNGGHVIDHDGTGSPMKYLPFDIETESPRKRHILDANANGIQTKFVAFDIENESSRKRHSLDGNSDTSASSGNGKNDTENDIENPVALATVLKTLFFILVWYTFSTCLTLYNKALLGDKLGKFPAPLLMNTVHFAMQALLSKSITFIWSQRFKPAVKMSWRDYFMRVVPTAVGTALDVNLSNASLVFISVTFATMCKSAAPIFLLLFAFAFKLESPSFKLLGIMLVISSGILLTVAKETEFQFWGFVFVMLAAVMSGFRWSMTQILLQKDSYGLKDPITLMSYVAPVMAVSTGVLSLFLDPWDEFRKNTYFDSRWHVLRSCLLMFIGATLAFFMVLTEFILVSATSAVTVTIAGVVKEAVTILVAVFYFHDQFTWLKGIGLAVIMVGVSLFNWYKYQKLQKKDQLSESDELGPSTDNALKYVILEEMDDQEEEA